MIKTFYSRIHGPIFLSCSHDNFNQLLSQIIKRRIFNGEWKAFLGSLQEGPNYLLTVSIKVIFNPRFSGHPIALSFSLFPLSRSLLPPPPSLLPILVPFYPSPFPIIPPLFPFYHSPFPLTLLLFPFTPPLPSFPSSFPFSTPLSSYPSLVLLYPISLPTYTSPVPFNPFPLPFYPSPIPFNPFPLTPSQFPLILSPFPLTPSPFLLPLLSSFIPLPIRFKGDSYVIKNLFQCASSYNHPQAYLHSNIPTPIPPKSILL